MIHIRSPPREPHRVLEHRTRVGRRIRVRKPQVGKELGMGCKQVHNW